MNPVVLDKVYQPAQVEARWYSHWERKGYFHMEPDPHREPFTIVIPPPNVTGMLTMGHVLNNTMQDILIRQARMKGKQACWIPGTDHASIATEAKVVKHLAAQGIRKEDLSRETFLEQAWAWKKKYGGIIISQLKKLGCSCDWQRERFTMDKNYSRAVLEAFVRLYHKGLIYRGHRLVNWCPVSQSAISDEEVLYRAVQGKLWYLRYPLVGHDGFVRVATTRPETMLGDTAIAVNPHDPRFKDLVGQKAWLPLVGRELPIIADDFVDPEFGTGCVKVTPAHDPNDYAMGLTHGLEVINIFNPDASLNGKVPDRYQGLSREHAREAVIADLKAQGLLEKVEDYRHKVGYSERGHVPIETYLSDQWFLRMTELAKPAREAVAAGKIRFHPAHWVKTYNHWMENIKDWCISRQLWWGHRIPVYTCQGCEQIMVQVEPPKTCSQCGGSNLEQDPDVLDTWASSWLWPFAVHSWPNESEELHYFYPTHVLVTGPDIIFFWVARMIMAGYEFMGKPPFKDVYFTSILRDERGRKFSKSLGNSPDPFELFNRYGTDAVRMGIMLMAPQGLDVLFSTNRLEIGRNFMNKLWNAARFVIMNLDGAETSPAELDYEKLDLPERWILHCLNRTIGRVDDQLKRFHFNEAAKVIYEFTWSDYCDWYVEIAKIRFQGSDPEKARQARFVAVEVLKSILALLHPYAPFITEDLWQHFKATGEPDLIVAPWPVQQEPWEAPAALAPMETLQGVITGIRTIRSQMNVPPARKGEVVIKVAGDHSQLIREYLEIIQSLTRIQDITIDPEATKPPHSAVAVTGGMEIYMPLEGLIDLALEQRRLKKRFDEVMGYIQGIERKLANENFLTRAPQQVIEREREKLQTLSTELEKVQSNLEMLQ